MVWFIRYFSRQLCSVDLFVVGARLSSFSIGCGGGVRRVCILGTAVNGAFSAAAANGVVTSFHVVPCCGGIMAFGASITSSTCVFWVLADSMTPAIGNAVLVGLGARSIG